jgi:hypothetical protein
LARLVGRCVPASHGRGCRQGARNAPSPPLAHSHSVPRRKRTHPRTRHARAPIVMIESDKISGLTTQQPENSTQDCLDCRLSDMLNTSSSVRYAPIPHHILSPFAGRYVILHLHAFVYGVEKQTRVVNSIIFTWLANLQQ